MTLREDIMAQARSRSRLTYSMDPLPDGITTTDCSLLVRDSVRDAGAGSLPRTAEMQRQATVPIGWDDVKPGDLLFFEHTYDAAGPAGPDGKIASHVGFSLGKGTQRMLDAHERNGPDVAETDISTDYWQEKLIEARRLPSLVTEAAAGIVDDGAGVPDTQLPGIDVSEYQGSIDWTAVAAAGNRFSLIRASQGVRITDKRLSANWPAARDAGVTRLAYHFAEPADSLSAQAELEWFLARVEAAGGLEAGDGVVLDLEEWEGVLGRYQSSLVAWTLDWLTRARDLTGAVPVLYTNRGILQQYGLTDPRLAAFPLHLAAWEQESAPSPPAPWSRVLLWQHADDGDVPGIAGNVDLDWFLGTARELQAIGKGGTVDTTGSTLDAWRDRVGSGILELMAADGTEPIMPSTWLPLGRGQADAEAEQCVAKDGRTYFWHLTSGRHFRYDPAA